MVTKLAKSSRVDKKTSAHIRSKREQSWLTRYPWPKKCIHDNVGEFNAHEFQELLNLYNIPYAPTARRMYQTVGNMPRTPLYPDQPRIVANAADRVDQALCTVMHALGTNIYPMHKGSLGALVFGRDMFLDVLLLTYW